MLWKRNSARGAGKSGGGQPPGQLPENPALLTALSEGAKNPQAPRTALMLAIRDATLIVPTHAPPVRNADGTADGLQLALFSRPQGDVLPVFTDGDAWKRFAPVQSLYGTFILGRDLCRVAVEGQFAGVAINPGSSVSYEMPPSECIALAQNLIVGPDHRLTVMEETPALIGMPAERPPQAFLDALRAAVAEAGAKEAYWFWIGIGGVPPHLGIAIAPDDDALAERVGQVTAPLWQTVSPTNTLVDVFRLAGMNWSKLSARQVNACCRRLDTIGGLSGSPDCDTMRLN